MTDDEITQALRSKAATTSLLGALELLIELQGDDLTQFGMIGHFKIAFPEIPLRILQEASTSRLLVGERGLRDDEFIELLEPWFESAR